MRTRTKIILVVGLVAALGGGAAWIARRNSHRGVEVQVGKVERKEIVSTVLANGKVQPLRKVDISANIAGQVVNLAVREGEAVAKGDFLLQIDQAQYQASTRSSEANLQSLLHDRDAAQANLEQARYDFDKARKSYEEQLIPEAELRRARSSFEAAEAGSSAAQQRVEQARAALEGARDTLSKTTIRAPLSGIVTALPIHEGEVAVIGTMNNPGTVLMTIADLSEMDADLAVDETDLPRLEVGQKATLTIEAYPDRRFEGLVREVGSSPIRPGSDAATRTGSTTTEAIDFEVKVTLLDPPQNIRPGFSVTAEIETGRAADVAVIPIQALVTREAPQEEGSEPAARGEVEEGVYVLDEGKARFVPLETGLTGALEIEVREGLEEGDEVIIGPFRALRELEDGATVRVAPTRPERSGADRGA
jgi:HlyD family secretion protein